jgi:osmoprotectant transport system substrate-binding protein
VSLNRRTFITSSAAASFALATANTPNAAFAQDNPTVTVGSKDFTEVGILGQIMSVLLEENGFPVDRQLNLGGTVVVHEAAVANDIQVYPEYTGTGLLVILGQDIPEMEEQASATPANGAANPVSEEVYSIVSEAYPEQFGLEWLEPFGLNGTYVIAVRLETAEEHGLQKVSDLQGIAGDLTFGCSQEFLVRQDGLPGLQEAYDVEFGDSMGMDPSLVYAAMDEGMVDVIAGGVTEGHIQRLGFVMLEDDRDYFPPYYACPVVRTDLLDQAPEVRDILNQLAGRIGDEKIGQLNLEVDEDLRNPVDVARDFLIDEGLIEG